MLIHIGRHKRKRVTANTRPGGESHAGADATADLGANLAAALPQLAIECFASIEAVPQEVRQPMAVVLSEAPNSLELLASALLSVRSQFGLIPILVVPRHVDSTTRLLGIAAANDAFILVSQPADTGRDLRARFFRVIAAFVADRVRNGMAPTVPPWFRETMHAAVASVGARTDTGSLAHDVHLSYSGIYQKLVRACLPHPKEVRDWAELFVAAYLTDQELASPMELAPVVGRDTPRSLRETIHRLVPLTPREMQRVRYSFAFALVAFNRRISNDLALRPANVHYDSATRAALRERNDFPPWLIDEVPDGTPLPPPARGGVLHKNRIRAALGLIDSNRILEYSMGE